MKNFLLLFLMAFVSCSASQIVRRDSLYILSKGDLKFCVSAEKGGRIVSCQRGGEEILLPGDGTSNYYGAVLWISPQRDYWPPSPTLDRAPYHAEIKRNTLRLVSANDSLTGLRFIKEFSISERDTAIQIHYIIENVGDSARSVAAWDVSRVFGGVSFFPLKTKNLPGLESSLEHLSESDGILWYDYANDSTRRGQKLFAQTSEGWLAHQYRNLLFVKTFPQIKIEDLPVLQGEVEIFLSPDASYLELENHGAYTRLERGQSLVYDEKWFLWRFPENRMQAREEWLAFIRNNEERFPASPTQQ
ncbi:MAG: DUF4380 domain-containing protein [Dysgonamonadaceae bacterium]|nr:DUF4380 domain-containing protein [Dysgonamonadaceae bacterium]